MQGDEGKKTFVLCLQVPPSVSVSPGAIKKTRGHFLCTNLHQYSCSLLAAKSDFPTTFILPSKMGMHVGGQSTDFPTSRLPAPAPGSGSQLRLPAGSGSRLWAPRDLLTCLSWLSSPGGHLQPRFQSRKLEGCVSLEGDEQGGETGASRSESVIYGHSRPSPHMSQVLQSIFFKYLQSPACT